MCYSITSTNETYLLSQWLKQSLLTLQMVRPKRSQEAHLEKIRHGNCLFPRISCYHRLEELVAIYLVLRPRRRPLNKAAAAGAQPHCEDNTTRNYANLVWGSLFWYKSSSSPGQPPGQNACRCRSNMPLRAIRLLTQRWRKGSIKASSSINKSQAV